MNTEDSSLIRISVMQNLPAHKASYNENDKSVMSDKVNSITEILAVHYLFSTINTEDSSMTETLVVHNLHTQKASCDKYNISTINTEDSSLIKLLAV